MRSVVSAVHSSLLVDTIRGEIRSRPESCSSASRPAIEG
jgi:hypothetical protein